MSISSSFNLPVLFTSFLGLFYVCDGESKTKVETPAT